MTWPVDGQKEKIGAQRPCVVNNSAWQQTPEQAQHQISPKSKTQGSCSVCPFALHALDYFPPVSNTREHPGGLSTVWEV